MYKILDSFIVASYSFHCCVTTFFMRHSCEDMFLSFRHLLVTDQRRFIKKDLRLSLNNRT